MVTHLYSTFNCYLNMHQYDITQNLLQSISNILPKFAFKQIYIPISNKFFNLPSYLWKNIMEYDYDMANNDEELHINSSKCYNGNIDKYIPFKKDITIRCMPLLNIGMLLMLDEMVNTYKSVILYKDTSSIYSYIKCSQLKKTFNKTTNDSNYSNLCIDYFHIIQIEMQYLVNHYNEQFTVKEESFTPQVKFSINPIKVYTDGSSIKTKTGRNNGCAVVIPFLGKIYMQHMTEDSTNIKAELQAICNALDIIHSNKDVMKNVVIYTDSEFSIKAITGEFKNLKENMSWINYARNRIEELNDIQFSFQFVKAHTKKTDEDSYYNDLCDKSAKRATSSYYFS